MPIYRAVFEVECLIEVSPGEKQETLESLRKRLERSAEQSRHTSSVESVQARSHVDGKADPAATCPNCYGHVRPTCQHCGYRPHK